MRYDVFGDTVNVAARMEATGEVCPLPHPHPSPFTTPPSLPFIPSPHPFPSHCHPTPPLSLHTVTTPPSLPFIPSPHPHPSPFTPSPHLHPSPSYHHHTPIPPSHHHHTPSLSLQPMRVHVSEAAAEKLRGTKFILQERGKVEVKVSVLCLVVHTYTAYGEHVMVMVSI